MKKIMALILSIAFVLTFIVPAVAVSSIPVKSIKVDKSAVTLNIGQTNKIKVAFTPTNTSQTFLTYETGDINVAGVSSNGVITAFAPGTTKITIKSLNKDATASLTITVLKTTYLKDTSPITLDWYVDENWFTRAKWGDDLTSKMITKKTGVTLNIIIPTGDSTAKKTTMIASGDLPDIMGMGQWLPEWRQLQKADMLWSFQDLAQKYDPTFFDVAAKSELAYWKSEDGKNYVYPNSNWPSERVADAKYLTGPAVSVRSDIYEAIGKPDMSTTAGFLNALKLAKQKFPKINGQSIIPFLLGDEFVSDGSRALDSKLLTLLNISGDKNGKFYKYDARTDLEAVTWLKTFRKATELGYITKDQFTAKDAQILAMLKSGRVFATMYAANTVMQVNGGLYKAEPKSIFIPVTGIQNSKKQAPSYNMAGLAGWHVNMITKKCKDPARAIQFLHYWLSDEGQSDFYFGDTSMYVIKDGKKYMKDDIYNLRDTDELKFCRTYGGRDNYFMLLQNYTVDAFKQSVQPYEAPFYKFWQSGTFVDTSEFEGVDPEANSPADIALQKTRAKWGQIAPKLLIAKSDAALDILLKTYNEESKKNAEVFMPEIQKKYQANKTLLNK